MSQFKKTSFYPSGFDPRRMENRQTEVPAQQMRVSRPFDPSENPDLRQEPPYGFEGLSIVRHVWNSRPRNAFDFYWQDDNRFAGGVQGYRVPDGFNLMLESVSVFYDLTSMNPLELATRGPISPFGNTGWTSDWAFPFLQILVDGAPPQGGVPQTDVSTVNSTYRTGGIPLHTAFMEDVEVPVFIPIRGGSVVRALLVYPPVAVIPVENQPETVHYRIGYHGTILMDTGRDTSDEVGNGDPEPVTQY